MCNFWHRSFFDVQVSFTITQCFSVKLRLVEHNYTMMCNRVSEIEFADAYLHIFACMISYHVCKYHISKFEENNLSKKSHEFAYDVFVNVWQTRTSEVCAFRNGSVMNQIDHHTMMLAIDLIVLIELCIII